MIKIKINMPKSCLDCPMANRDQGYCQIIYESFSIYLDSRLDDCPLIEVKERRKNER